METSLPLKEIVQNSPVIMVLIGCSFLFVAFALERLWYFAKVGKTKRELFLEIRQLVSEGKTKEAMEICRRHSSLMTEILHAGLSASHLSRADAEETIDIAQERGRGLLKRRLAVFGTLAYVAPLIGLLGTVVGVIRSFHDLSQNMAGGVNVVAAGISEALWATAAGILVAVPAAVLYNYFTSRTNDILSSAGTYAQELVVLLYGTKR